MRSTRARMLLLALAAIAVTGVQAIEKSPLDSLGWLEGCWGEIGASSTEECWTAPRGGLLLGVHRDTNPRGAFFEYLRIEADDENGLVYYASPMGRPATAFPLAALETHRVRFENPDHDWPQRIVYELSEAGDALRVRAEGLAAESRRLEWTWTRLPCRDGA